MAKSLLQMRSKKKPRVTRSESYLVNEKYLGEEPISKSDAEITEAEYAKCLSWYNYMVDTKERRGFIKDYLKSNQRGAEAKKFDRVSDTWVPTTAAAIARMISRGFKLPASSKPFLEKSLAECLLKARDEEPETEEKTNVVSIQDRIRDKVHDIIGDVEAMIDSGEPVELYDWLKKSEIPAMHANKIAAYYRPIVAEFQELVDGGCEQLKEAYSHMSKKQQRDRLAFFENLVEQAERYAGVTKKMRAPRKPRAVSLEKQLKHLKYMKESTEYKLASINPEKILGAQELWCFNTKYRTVTVFRALDRGGLKVKRSSIVNYDEKTSMTRGTGRQTEKVVDKIMQGGKIILKKVMDELKGNQSLQERINENTILLKVVT